MSEVNKKTSGTVSLQNIVANVLNDLNIYSKENYKRYMQWVIRAFTQLNMYTLRTVETVILSVSDTGAAIYPKDFIDYARIGECIGGKIYELGYNADLCLPRATECGEDVNANYDSDSEGTGAVSLLYNYPLGYRWYGVRGGQAESYYNIDRELGQIQLSNSITGDLVLQYISSGVSINGDTYIPRQAQESLIAFVHWQKSKWDGEPLNRTLMLKRDFEEEETKLTNFETIPTLQEILDVFYESWSQTPVR